MYDDYVAGPMTGIENYNWTEFEDVAWSLRQQGRKVITPTEIDEQRGDVIVIRGKYDRVLGVTLTEHFDYEKVLEADLEAVSQCTRIVLLNGWHRSSGAKRELAHALALGLTVELAENIV